MPTSLDPPQAVLPKTKPRTGGSDVPVKDKRKVKKSNCTRRNGRGFLLRASTRNQLHLVNGPPHAPLCMRLLLRDRVRARAAPGAPSHAALEGRDGWRRNPPQSRMPDPNALWKGETAGGAIRLKASHRDPRGRRAAGHSSLPEGSKSERPMK